MIVRIEFQDFSFTPCLRVLFTFPSRYLFTIGLMFLLRLRGRYPLRKGEIFLILPFLNSNTELCFTFQLVNGILWIHESFSLEIQGFHLLWHSIPSFFYPFSLSFTSGLFRVRSPLLTESRLMYIPSANEMFQFTPYFLFSWFPERRSIIHSNLLIITFRLCERPNNINLGIHSIR